MSALVGVIMGSKSDWSTLSHTAEMLDKLGIPYEVKVVSAHRTPDLLFQYAETAAAMLAHDHADVAAALERFRREQTEAVLAKPDPRA